MLTSKEIEEYVYLTSYYWTHGQTEEIRKAGKMLYYSILGASSSGK